MKKIKNGFTFVELLAVVTIIAVLALIALPTIERITKENKEKVYQQQLNNIILSLKSWASDNREYLPEEENEILTITLGNLKSDGYIEYEVKNPSTNKCFDNSMALTVTKIKKNYNYSIDLDTIKESDNCQVDIDSPVIVLNGNTIENIEVNSIYFDKGVSAKDKEGNDITSSVITTITGSGNVVNTSEIGNQYLIVYSVTANGKTSSISRTVKVADTTAPTLIIPSNQNITIAQTSFDVMNGVSASDNSGENIEVTAKSNITFGIAGTYTITYTATDSSGNTATKRRNVTISKVINGIMAANLDCIKDINSVCPNGTEVSVQVNSTQSHDFYVINDTGTMLTLIMDRNLGDSVAWIDATDYTTENNKDEAPDTCSGRDACNDEGPITAINYLDGLTDEEWSNIPAKPYIYSGLGEDGTTRRYEDITKTMRARMITYVEAKDIKTANNGTMPTYMYGGESYWTSTAISNGPLGAWRVTKSGDFHGHGVNSDATGVRPVITISK